MSRVLAPLSDTPSPKYTAVVRKPNTENIKTASKVQKQFQRSRNALGTGVADVYKRSLNTRVNVSSLISKITPRVAGPNTTKNETKKLAGAPPCF